MADDGQHPSKCKNPKPTFRNPHKVKEEELVYSISSSDDFDSESEEDTDKDEDGRDSAVPDWSDMPTNMKNFPFLKTNETLVPIPGNNEPIDYFRWICDDIFLNSVVDGTNYYAEVLRREGTSNIPPWEPLTLEELLTFIALLLHTGTIRMDKELDYWNSHPLFNLKCFSAHMSSDRFGTILNWFHFARNRFDEIQEVSNFFNNKMSSIYYPGKELSIDEPMVLWDGRLVSRRSIRNNTNKDAVRLYMLTEPSGMILKYLVYCRRKGHPTRVVLKLLEGYLDNGHSVYMNNFYNSFDLVNQLTKRSTYCTGTLDVKRKNNPETVITKKLKKEETVVQYANNIMVGKWKDVLYISNEYGNDLIKNTDNRKRGRKEPKSIFHYNKYMGGIDRQDQLKSYYPCEQVYLVLSNKLAIHLFQMMLLNSYLLFNKCSQTKMSLYDFRLAVLSSLLHIEPEIPVSRDDDSLHVLTKIPSVRNDGRVNRKRCRECSKNKLRKQTIYHCSKCPDQPGFCVGECFTKAHL